MGYLKATFFFWIIFIYMNSSINGDIVLRIDPLALLSATLRTYQKAACDTDQVVIACPRGTSISIEFAQYNKFIAKDGISIEELCPITTENSEKKEIRSKSKHLLRGSIFGSSNQKVPANRYASAGYGGYAASFATAEVVNNVTNSSDTYFIPRTTTLETHIGEEDDSALENCMWPNALQYSLLQTVVEACQKKKRCKFHASSQYYGLGASGVGDTSGSSSYHSSTASSNAISADPCPKRRKIVEVAYKCRPYEFRSKVACHKDVAQLECNPYARIAVYSASFGRTEYESIQCPQPQGVREETCLASYATETVMQICHGRRRCNLAADANTFGSPCQPNSRMYLKVVYTCVPKQVLKENNESDVEPDENDEPLGDMYDDEEGIIYKESEAIPKLYSNTTDTIQRKNVINLSGNSGNVSGTNSSFAIDADNIGSGVNPVMTHSADLSSEDEQERLYLYLIITGALGLLLSIIIIATRLAVKKHQTALTDTHLNSSTKGTRQDDIAGGVICDETTIPNGFNDTISEIDTDIDLKTTIPVPSVSKNENYVTYGPSSSLYSSLGPIGTSTASGNVSTPSTTAGLLANTLIVGARQSPDIIGISSNTFVATSSASGNGQGAIAGILAPAIVIGANDNVVNSGSNTLSTMVPITSLAQYTTAPTIHAGYLINPEGVLQGPQQRTPTPPTSSMLNNCQSFSSQTLTQSPLALPPPFAQLQSKPQHYQTLSHMPTSSTLRRTKPGGTTSVLQQQLSYDGTAPRILSTGVAVNSQFYYG